MPSLVITLIPVFPFPDFFKSRHDFAVTSLATAALFDTVTIFGSVTPLGTGEACGISIGAFSPFF